MLLKVHEMPRIKIRTRACEHERVVMPSCEKVEVEIIRKDYLKMHDTL